ncbi:expressed unknown protein [Seminavis robusta]|uniref:MYND-type domain-containing protein n=1 Tax=Seminavis robusta TaxID=568900 RepID=A0A9N8H3A6_9STRA|nr:expressed unknown protein [Seminavis robusta]|eukprot:Sro55_g032520.1 n/a (335) ;mRNA; r:137547-138551
MAQPDSRHHNSNNQHNERQQRTNNTCAHCDWSPRGGLRNELLSLTACGMCLKVVYCSDDCQTAGRKTHMIQCKRWEMTRTHLTDESAWNSTSSQLFNETSTKRTMDSYLTGTMPEKQLDTRHHCKPAVEAEEKCQVNTTSFVPGVSFTWPFLRWTSALEMLQQTESSPKTTTSTDWDRCRSSILQCWDCHLQQAAESLKAGDPVDTSQYAFTGENLWNQLSLVLCHESVARVILEKALDSNKEDGTPLREFFAPLIGMLDLKNYKGKDSLEIITNKCAATLVMQARRQCGPSIVSPFHLEAAFTRGMDDVQLAFWKGVALPTAKGMIETTPATR